jgi:predicted PurR-regulated permease PerM
MLIVVLLFHLLRDGERLAQQVAATVAKIGGRRGGELLETAQRTVVGVMVSVLGTSLAQALVAALGFSIASIPNPPLLAALTFVLSMAPVGPPIIWGGATLWLMSQDQPGWAAFMGLYGLLGISSVDNLLKPFLISRSSHLPFVLTLFGVIGGVFAFGVVGAFLGPTLLALAVDLYNHGASSRGDEAGAVPPGLDPDQ